MSTTTTPSTIQTTISQPPSMPTFKSTGMVFVGALLLLLGYLGSYMLLMLDLSGATLEDGTPLPSPLGAVIQSTQQMWLIFEVDTLMIVAGSILVASQPFCSLVAVAYIMCPIVGLVYLLGAPLRGDKSWNRRAAQVYLLIGIVAVIAGAVYLKQGPADPAFPLDFVGAGFALQFGLAATLGAILRLKKTCAT